MLVVEELDDMRLDFKNRHRAGSRLHVTRSVVAAARAIRDRVAGLIAVMLVMTALAGCRGPDPVYDRTPRPIATRDLVRAERRAASPLNPAERIVLETLHDGYLASFDEFRESELIPFAEYFRDLSPQAMRNDERALRSVVSRHRSILSQLESLDETFVERVSTALGPARSRYVALLRARRVLDRASALTMGDGGGRLLDVHLLVDRLDVDPQQRATIDSLLAAHDAEAGVIAAGIMQEQATLPLSYITVVQRRGPPQAPPGASGKDRQKAIEHSEQERFAESRKDLESLLHRYAALVDRTIELIAAELPEDQARQITRSLIRTRVNDQHGGSSDTVAFEALIASRAREIPAATRDSITALRSKFLAEDEQRSVRWIELYREAKAPGVLDPVAQRGGAAATQARRDRVEALDKERSAAIVQFRAQLNEMIPESVREEIGQLARMHREEFTAALGQIVGAGRVSSIVAARPRGFGDRAAPVQRPSSASSDDPGELRMVLAPMPDEAAVNRLLSRSDLDETSSMVLRQIVTLWREQWEATREPARQRVLSEMPSLMNAMNMGDIAAFDRAVQRVMSSYEELRREREQLDAELLSSLDAASADSLDRAARQLWIYERDEAERRLRWSDVPWENRMRLAVESTVPFMETINRAIVTSEAVTVVSDVLTPLIDELNEATESLRHEGIIAVRKAMGLVMKGRLQGQSDVQALDESVPEVRRMLAPLRTTADRLAMLRVAALGAIVEALPTDEGRGLREAFVRSAYPRLLENPGRVEESLIGVRSDPSLTDAQRAAIDDIIAQRSERRDRELDRILDWNRGLRTNLADSGEDLRQREAASRRYPQLGAMLFAREEADARATTAAKAILTSAQMERHRDLDAYFDEHVQGVRWLD